MLTILTTEEVLKMARQVGLSVENPQLGYTERHHVAGWITDLEAFAKLVASEAIAKEREACAKVCEEHGKVWAERFLLGYQATLDDAAEAIRARGNNT